MQSNSQWMLLPEAWRPGCGWGPVLAGAGVFVVSALVFLGLVAVPGAWLKRVELWVLGAVRLVVGLPLIVMCVVMVSGHLMWIGACQLWRGR